MWREVQRGPRKVQVKSRFRGAEVQRCRGAGVGAVDVGVGAEVQVQRCRCRGFM